jgi:hypothetical protein
LEPLARLKEDGSLEQLAKAQPLTNNAWTVPTVVGATAYLRDRKVILAVDIG